MTASYTPQGYTSPVQWAMQLPDTVEPRNNAATSDLGARFIQIQLGGWDHHQNIYNQTTGIYPRARELDSGVAALLADLEDTPGKDPGKTLLDETLVVVMGEFGRTVENLNNQQGRDHYLQQSVVFAGGGAKGGRVIGATNDTGAYTIDAGWSRNRTVRPRRHRRNDLFGSRHRLDYGAIQ